MSGYTIKKLERNQFDLLIPLMKDCFGMDVNIEYFKWKFLDNPAGSYNGFIAVEEKTGEVAAYYGVIPEKYIIEGKEKIIYQSGDTMTHSNHRRRGLFQKLALHCYNYLRDNGKLFVIGFGGARSTPGLIKFGWKRVFDFRHLFVPKILCYSSLLSKSVEVESISDLQILKPLIEIKPSAKIYSFRNIEHLRWRYGNPRYSYKVNVVCGDSGIAGYVCYYIDNNKITLFDFVFTSETSRKSLIGNLKRKVLKENLKGIVAFCQENSLSTIQLRQSGFFTNPFNRGHLHEKTPFMFYSDEKTMNNFFSPDCWAILGYDYDAS